MPESLPEYERKEVAQGCLEAVKDAFLPLKPCVEKELDLLSASMEADKQYAAYLRKSQGGNMSDPVERGKAYVREQSQQFKPGQTVWNKKSGGLAGQIVATNRDRVWIATEHTSFLAPASDFTATDPNAKPLPQACPFCGGSSDCNPGQDGDHRAFCDDPNCAVYGPWRRTREEAIAAWNSIRIVKE